MSNRIYLGNLNNDISKFELEEYVKQFGTVIDMLYKNSYAFVEFSKNEEAEEALKKLDGFLLKGRRIKAQMAKALNQDKEAPVTTNRLYVGRIAEANITKFDLQQLFEPFGEIEDILLKEDYAFIQYKNLDSAQRAKQLHNTPINGQKIVVQEAKNRDQQNEIGSTRLFIGRITPEITREDIMQLFSPLGEVLDINMKQDFAFVEYSNKASALQALQKLDQFSIKGTRIQVQEAKGPKNDRNRQSHQNSKYSKNYSSKNSKNNSKRNRRDRSNSSYSSGSQRRSYSRSRSRSRDRRRGGRGNQNQQQNKYQKQNFQQRKYQWRGHQGGDQQQQPQQYQQSSINQQQQLSAFYQQLNQQTPNLSTIPTTTQLTGLNTMIPPQQDMMSYYQQSTVYKAPQQPSIPILQQQQPVQYAQQQQLWQRLNSDKPDF